MTEDELNALIDSAQTQMDALRDTLSRRFAALGEKLYPELCETETASQFEAEFKGVGEILAAIDAKQNEIDAALYTFLIANDDDASVPDEDAETATAAPVSAARVCPKCGGAIYVDDKFCGGCGSKVAELFAAPAKAYCHGCGHEVDSTMNFCIYCGTKLR